jgi:nucleoside 2-deoxyribosyltransferase
MKLYLAGPMSGHEDHNFPTFHRYAAFLRTLGYTVVNPAEMGFNEDLTKPWEFYMKKDIALLCQCDGIAMIPGWTRSRGAVWEYAIAIRLQMPVLHLSEIPVPACPQTDLFAYGV